MVLWIICNTLILLESICYILYHICNICNIYSSKITQMQCVSCDVSLILPSKSISNRLISQYTEVFKEFLDSTEHQN